MRNKQSFDKIVEIAMRNHSAVMRPVIEKEIFHYEIFSVLNDHKLLSPLIFQGGTSLRLCRGSNRFSEDLDFVGGHDFTKEKRLQLKSVLQQDIGEKFGLNVTVKEPKSFTKEVQEGSNVAIDKWQISIETAPEHSDIPRQRIKLEIADVPAHTKELVPLNMNYLNMQGYGGLFINAETVSEVLADKLLALPMTTSYIRHRDVWDIAWLTQQQAHFDGELLGLKLNDYNVSEDDYLTKLDDRLKSLSDIVNSADFRKQMERFIDPVTVARTLAVPDFLSYLESTVKMELEKAQSFILDDGAGAKPHKM